MSGDVVLLTVEEWLSKIGGLRPVSLIILSAYALGIAIPSNIAGIAAIHIIVLLIQEYLVKGKYAGPTVDPNTVCNNCGERNFKIVRLDLICKKCNHKFRQFPSPKKKK